MRLSSSRWWSVESKEFGLSVVGGFTGIRIHERRKGVLRSILIDKDEAAWLIKSFHDLVTVLDSRVFWNQTVSGFPRILAQQCANRHGYFLTIEEYEGRRRKGSVLVPKGRFGEGWKRFGEELRLALNSLLAGSSPEHFKGKAVLQPNRLFERRRSYADVLRAPLPKEAGLKMEELAKDFPAKPAGQKAEKMEKDFPPNPAGLKIQNAGLAEPSDRVSVSDLRGRGEGYSPSVLPSAPRKSHVGDCLELCSIRKTLETLHEEIRFCLAGLRQLEDEVMGRSNSLGSSPSRPNSLLPDRTSLSPPKSAHPLQFPIKRPKFLFKPKAGSVLRPIPTRQFSMDVGASSSAGPSKPLGRCPAISKASCKPSPPSRVYQRRKSRNRSSSTAWRAKPGLTIPETGTRQSREMGEDSSRIGEQNFSPASEELLCGGLGEPKVFQPVDSQLEELSVSGLGLESNGDCQSGLESTLAGEATVLGEKGSVAEMGISMVLSAEDGGLMLASQVNSSLVNAGLGCSGFGVDSVAQRQEEGSLELVFFSSSEGKVGLEPEACSGGPLVGKCPWEGMVAEKGNYYTEGLLLQDKDRNGGGMLESYEPIVITPLAVEDVDGQRVSPRWVVERIKRFYPTIGLSCGRFEDRLLALFEEIEADRDLSLAELKTKLSPAKGVKGQRELNRLSWSMNYEKRGEQSDKGRHKGRGPSRVYDA